MFACKFKTTLTCSIQFKKKWEILACSQYLNLRSLMPTLIFSEEADLQYRRDKKVEEEMIKILAGRVKDCLLYNEGQTYGQHGEVMGHVDESLNPCQAMMVRLTIISSNRIFC